MTASPFILIVDDDRNIALVLAHLVRSAGFRAEAVKDAWEAISLARKDRPDLILMDMMMPGLEGPTATQMIKSTPEFASLPVILISAMPEEEARKRVADSGAADFIAKPFYRKTLLEAIERWLPQRTNPSGKPVDETRILIVDDDSAVRKMLASALRNLGFGVWEAGEAEEGLRLAQKLLPGLIVSDVDMPGISGTEFCLQLKSSAATKHIPVVFVSGVTDHESHMIGKISGGSAYFDKPLNMPAFLSALTGLLLPPKH